MSSDSSEVLRPRRPPVRLSFDPMTQPWTPSALPFSAVPSSQLTPQALRAVLTGDIQRPLDIPNESLIRLPGREGTPVEAAVLVPIVLRPEGLTVLLTQRTAHLNDHAGQISFPGGRVEASDVDAQATALRETEEETGLSRDFIECLGGLPRYVTGTGFAVSPITALVQPGFELNPDTFEVAEIFEVPLAFLTDPANYRLHHAKLVDGSFREYYSVPWKQYFIWGATASMLLGMCQILSEAATTRP
jgi:8-oxo-dGTP pyrophosphatase MutT (NUDIX family)